MLQRTRQVASASSASAPSVAEIQAQLQAREYIPVGFEPLILSIQGDTTLSIPASASEPSRLQWPLITLRQLQEQKVPEGWIWDAKSKMWQKDTEVLSDTAFLDRFYPTIMTEARHLLQQQKGYFLPAGEDVPPDMLAIRIVGQPALAHINLWVRRTHFYEDINNALNHLWQNEHKQKYVMNLLPPLSVNYATGEHDTKGLPVPVQAKQNVDTYLLRHGLQQYDVAVPEIVIPIKVSDVPIISLERMAKTLFLARQIEAKDRSKPSAIVPDWRTLLKKKQQSAWKAIGQHPWYQGTALEDNPLSSQEQELLQNTKTYLTPLLSKPLADLTTEEIDQAVSFVLDALPEASGQRVLFQWAEEQIAKQPDMEGAVWPLVKWVVGLLDEDLQERAVHQKLADIQETTDPVAFQTVPLPVPDLHWAQCENEACQKWRVIHHALTTEEQKEPWYCYSEAGGGMDVRGLPDAKKLLDRIDHLKVQLSFPMIPNTERHRLQEELTQHQMELCQFIDEENDETARARLAEYVSAVVVNPEWEKHMKKQDLGMRAHTDARKSLIWLLEQRDQRKQELPSTQAQLQALAVVDMSDLSGDEEEEDSDEEDEVKLPARKRSENQRLRRGIGGAEDRALMSQATYLGGDDRDRLDMLNDIYDELTEEKDQLLAQIITEAPAQQTETHQVLQEMGVLASSASSESVHKLKLLEEKLDNIQREKETLQKHLTKDPNLPPDVSDVGKNETFILRTLADFPRGMHYKTDLTPMAEALKTEESGRQFSTEEAISADVIHGLTNPNKYMFLGRLGNSIGNPFVRLRPGFLVLRSLIKTPTDVSHLLTDAQQTLDVSASKELEIFLTQIQRENQIFPYVLAGAWSILSEAEGKPLSEKTNLLRAQFSTLTEALAHDLVSFWDTHVDEVQKQLRIKRKNSELSRSEVLKYIKPTLKNLEKAKDGTPVAGMRLPWWKYSDIILPLRTSSKEILPETVAVQTKEILPETVSVQTKDILPETVSEVEPRKRQREETSVGSDLKAAKVSCSPEELEQLRIIATKLNLVIAQKPEYLHKLCFDVGNVEGTRTYLQRWRAAADELNIFVASHGMNPALIDDKVMQKLTLQYGFQTSQQREAYQKAARQHFRL